ncbi:MAG: nitroreductase family protein [Oscillospiraceae bacterium]|nr:nitroreductase family protein [Oscillospiraceae bacterium]
MSDLFEVIGSRISYRGEYKPEAVPEEHLRAIMEAGLAAPSGCNQQTTSLIAVNDRQVLDKVQSCLRENLKRPICQSAPAVICVLSQDIKSYHGMSFSKQDYAAAIQNMLLAIKALGYDSCWFEGYMTDESGNGRKIADILGVPAEYDLVCILPVGIAADTAKPVDKKAFSERAWFNSFGG